MVRGVNHDRLIPAKRTGCSASNFVPELQQVPFRFRRESEFQRDLPTIRHLFTGWFGRADMLNARSIARLLQAHPEIDKVQNNLHVALRLHMSAHDAEADKRLPIFRDKRRNDGVKWPFMRRVAV